MAGREKLERLQHKRERVAIGTRVVFIVQYEKIEKSGQETTNPGRNTTG
jgi:hypothetical protein